MQETATTTVSAERVRAAASRLGFEACGIVPVQPSERGAFLRAWLAARRHGSMAYLERPETVAARLDPASAWPGVRSALVLASNYYTDLPAARPEEGVIARYALGRDYHRVLKRRLIELLRELELETGRTLPLARAYVDTGPVLERELAERAGLGWTGRSTMLLHPRRGSYFFLATLLVELEFDAYDAPFQGDHCGTCTACVSACPTGALLGRNVDGAPVMDATRCISYLTIEHRGAIPVELRPLIGNRIFGCDICQEVCPWNGGKFVQITRVADFDGRERERERLRKRERAGTGLRELPSTALPSLISLMRMTYEEWDEWTRGSAMRRSGYGGIRRNVAVALGNWGSADALPALVEALSDPEPLVRGHAVWALGQIGCAEARAALAAHASVEADACVLEELSAAMDA